MGLDMYLEGEKYILTDWNDASKNPIEDGYELKSKILRLGYWRKHPNLHGYIVQNFADGVDNCEKIDLSIENLQQILSAVEADELPHTEGSSLVKVFPTIRIRRLRSLRELSSGCPLRI